MTTLLQEFKKHWAFHIVCTLCGGCKHLVNNVEPGFARSLISCSTPVTQHTGSAWCGDRLYVLQEGMKISARGQAQESMAMFFAVSGSAIVCNALGRRPALLIGIAATAVSVVTFLLATQIPSYAGALFAAGQGLQGFHPTDFLNGLMYADIDQMPTTDAPVFNRLKAVMAAVTIPFWLAVGNGLLMLELTEYKPIWVAILFFILLSLGLAIFLIPETRPTRKEAEGAEEDKGKSAAGTDEGDGAPPAEAVGEGAKAVGGSPPAQGERSVGVLIWEEVYSYKILLHSNPMVPKYLLYHFVRTFEGNSVFLISTQIMAYHAWSQTSVLLSFIPIGVMTIISNSLLVQPVSDRYGILQAYIVGCLGHFLVGLPERFAIVLNPQVWLVLATLRAVFNGRDAYGGLVEQWLYEAEDMPKVMNLMWITGYACGAVSFLFYSWTFDATSVTYWDQVRPNLIVIGIEMLKLLCFYELLWKPQGGFRDSLHELSGLQARIVAACEKAFEAMVGGPAESLAGRLLPDSSVREAGFVEVFSEWLDPNSLDSAKFEFKTSQDLFRAVRPFYDGKRLPEAKKVLQAAILFEERCQKHGPVKLEEVNGKSVESKKED